VGRQQLQGHCRARPKAQLIRNALLSYGRSPTPEDSAAGKYLEIVRELAVIKLHAEQEPRLLDDPLAPHQALSARDKRGGDTPYVTDFPEQIPEACARGHVSEVIDYPIVPVAGFRDEYYVERGVNCRALKSLKLGEVRVRNGELRAVFDVCSQCIKCARVAPGCIRMGP